MRQKFVAQFVKLLKRWLCDVCSSIVVKNRALSVDQCWLRVLQFSVHLIDLLSILLRCNGFCWDSASYSGPNLQQTTKEWPGHFFGASLALRSALDLLLSPTTELVINSCHIKFTFCHMSQSNQEMVHCCCTVQEKTTLQNDNFFICGQLMRHSRSEPFRLSILLQMPSDHTIVNAEFSGNFSRKS